MRRALLFAVLISTVSPFSLGQAKRPMTFDDMMAMKRLGETAVSPDGQWLAYSVTTVDLAENTKTPELWLKKIAGGDPIKLAAGQAGDSDPAFSPDGHSVLWVSGRENGQQIWLADFDPETGATSNPRRLTNIATEADSPKWSPDGRFIAFTSAVYPDCPAITSADFGTGNKCNADRDKALADSKVKAQIWTQLLYRHWNHYTGEKRKHIFLVSVESGATRDLNPGDPHDVPPFSLDDSSCGCDISPDGKELAFTENPDPVPAISTSAQIYTLDLTDPASKPVKVSTSAGGNFNPAYSPDGKYLAWRSQARAGYESDKFRLMLYDREKKTSEDILSSAIVFDPRPRPAHFDLWVDEFAWGEKSNLIYFTSTDAGESPIYSISLEPVPADVEMALHEDAVGQGRATLAGEGRHVVHRQLDRYGKIRGEWSEIHGIWVNHQFRFIGNLMRVDMPSEVALGDPLDINDTSQTAIVTFGNPSSVQNTTKATYEPTLVTHLNDALLAQLDLPKMDSFWFTAKDGTKLQGFLIRPPGFDPAKKYPLKFLIHGGPQGAWGDDWSYRWNAELFAANGYVVVMINPRGSVGYGQAMVDGVNGDWGGKPYTDLMTGLDYAEQRYPFIDKTRECALGASYGGYMANWILGHTNRFKCIVSHDGMFNAESAFGTTEEDWFNIWEFKGHPWDYYGKPDDQNPFRKWSPSYYAKNFKTPTLVIHSQLDYRLDLSEGLQLFDTLQLEGVPSKMLYFPDEGHWVLKPQNSELWWKTVNDWVDEWTKSSH